MPLCLPLFAILWRSTVRVDFRLSLCLLFPGGRTTGIFDRKNAKVLAVVFCLSVMERALSPPLPNPGAATSQGRSFGSCPFRALFFVVARPHISPFAERKPTTLHVQSLLRPCTLILNIMDSHPTVLLAETCEECINQSGDCTHVDL